MEFLKSFLANFFYCIVITARISNEITRLSYEIIARTGDIFCSQNRIYGRSTVVRQYFMSMFVGHLTDSRQVSPEAVTHVVL